MSFKFILFIIVQVGALVFFVEVLRRVAHRASEYGLKDNKHTVPFGIIKLKHIVVFYVFFYLLWVIGSVVVYMFFAQSDSVLRGGSQPTRTDSSIELNL